MGQQQAKIGDTIKVHYTCRLPDGAIYDTSLTRDPLEFKIGSGRLLPAFEEAVVGMTVEDSITINVLAKDAYGQYKRSLRQKIPRSRLPRDMEIEIGMELEALRGDGKKVLAVVTEITRFNVILDGNHPLAGKDLVFDIELLEIL